MEGPVILHRKVPHGAASSIHTNKQYCAAPRPNARRSGTSRYRAAPLFSMDWTSGRSIPRGKSLLVAEF
uniref:Uncharacterized protein n=1 Tax=Romanomermis culicivorax TaxID=13658 RepID=A0A915KEI0_ROMCU